MKIILLFIVLTFEILANIGNIMALQGEAEIIRSGQTIEASAGMEVFQGDKIITQSKTRTQIILKDDTIVTIGANSSFEFTTYLYDGTKNSTVKMKANRGFFRSVTGKIGKLAPKRFTVETSSATIGIRGTDFSVRLQNAIERFRCYSGGIRITFGNTVRDIKAGESFELNIHTLKALFTPIAPDIEKFRALQNSDLKKIEEGTRTVEHFHPKPDIPNGIPCVYP